MTETTNYKIYDNIIADHFTTWKKTDIFIPEGAMVVVMAEGTIFDHVNSLNWQPWQSLTYKIGKEGIKTYLFSCGDNERPCNAGSSYSGKGGFFYHSTWQGTHIAYPELKQGEFTARVIVWDKAHQNEIVTDIRKLISSHPEDTRFGYLLSGLAGSFLGRGEYAKSKKLLEADRKISSELGVNPGFGFAISAILEHYLSNPEKAKTYAEQAVKAYKRNGKKSYYEGGLLFLGMAYSFLGQHEKAISLLKQTLDSRSMTIRARSHDYLAWAYLSMEKPSEALEHGRQALKFYKKYDFAGLLPRLLCILGESQMKLGIANEARRSFARAIEEAAKRGQVEPVWMAHAGLGKIAEKQGDTQEAIRHYGTAINVIEDIRGKVTDPMAKARFAENKLYVYEGMIRLLRKMKNDPEAFRYLERFKARTMLDMIAEKAFSSRDAQENELLIKERKVRKRISQLSADTSINPLESRDELSKERISERVAELGRLKADHSAILTEIETLNPELASLVNINPLKANGIQELLGQDTAMLEYFIGRESQLVFAVTRDKVLTAPLKTSPEELFEMIRKFRAEAVEGSPGNGSAKEDYQEALSDLYLTLIAPVEKEIVGKKRLVIVPHGMLHYLPFQALRSESGKYLIESHAISYLPSASVLKYARIKNKENRNDLFAAGNPEAGLSPLPAAEKEVREISALFKKKLVLTGDKATETSVKTEGPNYDMMLLSTHGEMNQKEPLKSNLRFTLSEGEDGKLTVDEIFDMDIKANLVTLSACETALVKGEKGNFPEGDDLVGLSRAFIHAGAPSVVASLWKVSDESTVTLMRAFYKNLQTMPKSEALQKAQLELINSRLKPMNGTGQRGLKLVKGRRFNLTADSSHPYFWAPFVLVGDWR